MPNDSWDKGYNALTVGIWNNCGLETTYYRRLLASTCYAVPFPHLVGTDAMVWQPAGCCFNRWKCTCHASSNDAYLPNPKRHTHGWILLAYFPDQKDAHNSWWLKHVALPTGHGCQWCSISPSLCLLWDHTSVFPKMERDTISDAWYPKDIWKCYMFQQCKTLLASDRWKQVAEKMQQEPQRSLRYLGKRLLQSN